MNQTEFMKELSKHLQGFDSEERDNALQYYSEYLSDAEDPKEVISTLPHPAQIARELMGVESEREEQRETSKRSRKSMKIASLDEELQKKTLKIQLLLALLLEISMTLMVGVVTFFFGDEAVVNLETGAATSVYYSMMAVTMGANVVFTIVSTKKGTMTAFSLKYFGYFVLCTIGVYAMAGVQALLYDWDLVGWLFDMPQETLFQRVFYLFLLNALDGGFLLYWAITLAWVLFPMNAIRTYDRWKKEHKLYKSKQYA